MNKLMRIVITRRIPDESNPFKGVVEVQTSLDGIEWHMAYATTIDPGKDHPFGEAVPDEYVLISIIQGIIKLAAKGYLLVG